MCDEIICNNCAFGIKKPMCEDCTTTQEYFHFIEEKRKNDRSFAFRMYEGHLDVVIFHHSNWDINEEESADLIGHDDCEFSIDATKTITIDSFPEKTFWISEPNSQKERILICHQDDRLWISPIDAEAFETWITKSAS